jgi:hypothetical protein
VLNHDVIKLVSENDINNTVNAIYDIYLASDYDIYVITDVVIGKSYSKLYYINNDGIKTKVPTYYCDIFKIVAMGVSRYIDAGEDTILNGELIKIADTILKLFSMIIEVSGCITLESLYSITVDAIIMHGKSIIDKIERKLREKL